MEGLVPQIGIEQPQKTQYLRLFSRRRSLLLRHLRLLKKYLRLLELEQRLLPWYLRHLDGQWRLMGRERGSR
jgi:hypothetical protein